MSKNLEHSTMKRIIKPVGETVACPLCGSKYVKCAYYQTPVGDISNCRKCDLFFRYPQPNETALNDLYRTHYQISNIETEQTHLASPQASLAQILSLLDNGFGHLQGKTLLDYGCSIGTLAEMAKNAGMNVAGIEIDNSARQYAKQRGLRRVYRDIEELTQKEVKPKFDFVTSIEVMEHLRTPWDDLKCLIDLLSEDGTIFITTPNVKGLNARITRGKWREFLKPGHLYWFSYDSLRSICHKAGLLNVHRVKLRPDLSGRSVARGMIQRLLQCCGLGGRLCIVAKR